MRPFTAARPELRQRSKRSVHVLASWGAPVEFSPAKVVSNTKVTPELHQMVVDVGADKAAGYTKGGQFVQLKVGEGKPGFFAIASPPDPNNQGLLEFLIKAKGDAAEALAALPAGAEVHSSPVMGKGFPLERIPADACPTVLLFATGEPQYMAAAVLAAQTLCQYHASCQSTT
jgi:NAD(P)H-flavin reductase